MSPNGGSSPKQRTGGQIRFSTKIIPKIKDFVHFKRVISLFGYYFLTEMGFV